MSTFSFDHSELNTEKLDDGVVPINDTLTAFEDGLNDAIETAFNGTFIEDAIANYVQCVIGSKLDALESGLTWIHNNAHVDLFRGMLIFLLVRHLLIGPSS